MWQDHRGRTLADVLDQLPPDTERLYVTGPRPGGDAPGFRAWIASGPPEGWTVGDHHWHHARPVLRFTRPSGATVVVLRSASWWGETDQPARVQEDAAELLRRQLVRVFWSRLDDGPRRGLLDTPATTGRALMLSAMPFDLEVPQLGDDVRDLIRATTTQGRWQQWSPPASLLPGGAVQLDAFGVDEPADVRLPDGLDAYDLRFAYAALCRELPTGLDHHLDGGLPLAGVDQDAFLDGGEWQYRRCRVRIVGKVPAGWWGHGAVPVLVDGHEPSSCDACQRTTATGTGAVCWPSKPGAPFDTWVDGSEAALAAALGWRFRVVEALTFGKGRPLDGWADKLAEVRELLAGQWRADPANRPAVKLAADGCRMLLLQGIGALHGTASRATGTTDDPDAVPDDAEDVALLPDGSIEWTREQRASWSALDRPEWSSAVWGRCRQRIAWHRPQGSGLHTVDPASVVAVRQDALYLVAGTPVPWGDGQGRVGWLRPVTGVPGPCPWPTSGADLVNLRNGATA